jgi:hypothetical protein
MDEPLHKLVVLGVEGERSAKRRMLADSEVERMTKLGEGQGVMSVETIDKGHVVDGHLRLVEIDAKSLVEPDARLRVRSWCFENNVSVKSILHGSNEETS